MPKTIDNDLTHTDHTPGYGSAAKYIGTTIKELVRDSTIYDLKSVTVVEIMGRNAGWLTAAAALAEDEDCEGAAMICLPEVPFDPEHFIARVDALQQQTPSLVVAVSEGVRTAEGRYVCELAHNPVNVDAFGHTYLGGHGALSFRPHRRPAGTAKPAPSSFPPFSVVPRTSPVKPTFPNRSTWARSPWTRRLRAKPA